MTALAYKIATEPHELEQVHRLNYRTFVEEIHQHRPNPERRLVDRFHEENTYVVAVANEVVVGMIAARGRRPFSLDAKLRDLDEYLPAGRSPCELRLLAVEPAHRSGAVFRGLLDELWRCCVPQGFDLYLISGTVRQLKLYRHLGFVPFGPLVGAHEALFQPMYLALERFEERAPAFTREGGRRPGTDMELREPVSFLPGPVDVHPSVARAFASPPRSHRAASFTTDLHRIKSRLCAVTNAHRVEVLLGSGTLANDVIAARLAALDVPGMVLSNGEFGERLVDHAARSRLRATVVREAWGVSFARRRIQASLDAAPHARWLWAVQCETSTGMLNDVEWLTRLCADRGLRLCLDCISAIGCVSVDLQNVFLASGVSGKGLGAYPGLALVFHTGDRLAPPSVATPRYLDLDMYAASEGVPFTHSSNLIHALGAACERFEAHSRFAELALWSDSLRSALRQVGLRILGETERSNPAVVTIPLGPAMSSEQLGDRLAELGFLVSYRSAYLLERNWIQVVLMGAETGAHIHALASALRESLADSRATALSVGIEAKRS